MTLIFAEHVILSVYGFNILLNCSFVVCMASIYVLGFNYHMFLVFFYFKLMLLLMHTIDYQFSGKLLIFVVASIDLCCLPLQ